MRLSVQDKQWMGSACLRLDALTNQAFSNLPDSFHRVQELYGQEIMDLKVKFEMLHSETDVKEKSIFSKLETYFSYTV